ncbi:hypothetical protein [Burkholderia reimsis]|nr:hypothetical protein [Burkholderia reimsis]
MNQNPEIRQESSMRAGSGDGAGEATVKELMSGQFERESITRVRT